MGKVQHREGGHSANIDQDKLRTWQSRNVDILAKSLDGTKKANFGESARKHAQAANLPKLSPQKFDEFVKTKVM